MEVKQIHKELAFVNPHLPQTLIEWYRDSSPEIIHKSTQHTGIVACIDASGFTKLTRILSVDKKLGPEQLTNILNKFFQSMTDLVFHYQGDILKFAGDAIWVYFPNKIDITTFFQHALKAVEDMNQTSPELENSPIKIHIGAEIGSFCLASMGKQNLRLEIEPFGVMINDVMTACDIAKIDQMVLGPNLARLVPNYVSLHQPQANFYLLEQKDQASDVTIEFQQRASLNEPQHDTRLEQYIPKDLIERTRHTSKLSIAQSEFRDVTVLFANFKSTYENGLNKDEISSLNNKLSNAFDIIIGSNGSITRIDPYYDGHKLLVLFGAPIKHEDDELNALHCAVKLIELADNNFDLRIGLAYGSLFCGDVGAETRREYTVMGEAVNMSARLMSQASWQKILINNDLRNKLPKNILTENIELSLKGIGNNVISHQFRDITEETFSKSKTDSLIGRNTEYRHLRQFLNQSPESQLKIMTISGDAGVGKSLIVENTINDLKDTPTITISGRHSFLYGQAWVAKKLINNLFSIFQQNHYQSLKELAIEKIESKWQPLMREYIDITVDDNIWIKGLSQQQKSNKSSEIYSSLISAIISNPVQIIIDDFDQIDDYSTHILLYLLNQPEHISGAFILILREDTLSDKLSHPNKTELKINPPTNSEWNNYFNTQLADGKRELELIEKIITISKGNPLFISEFLNRLHNQNKLQLNKFTNKYELIESFGEAKIPHSINDIYLSKFDLFSETDKRMLKTASVFETLFSIDALYAIVDAKDKIILKQQLDKFVENKVLEFNTDNRLYGFIDKSFQSIIYSCLPESLLLKSHNQIANYFESSSDSFSPSVLANHYFKSKQWQKAFTFSLKAANEALSFFALSEASQMFKQCKISLDSSIENDILPVDIYNFYDKYNTYLVLEGDLDTAYKLLTEWKTFAGKENNNLQKISANLEEAQIDWQQTKYNECRNALEKVLQYPDIKNMSVLYARAHAILAEVERRSGNFSLAQKCCQQSINSYKKINDYLGLSDSYNKLGLALWGEGKLDQATENYELSLQYGKDVNGMIVQAQTSNNLAIIRWEQGDFLNAERLMKHALEITKQIGDRRDEAYVSGNLSSIQKILGRFKSSRELLQQADMIFQRLNDTHAHNYVLGNLGDIDLIEGKHRDAYSKFSEVLKFAKEVDDKELDAECQIRMGEILFYTGKIDKAKTKFEDAILLANQIDSSEYSMRAAIGLCRLYIGDRYLKEINPLIEETLIKATVNNSNLIINEIGFIKGELHRLQKNQSEANICYHKTLSYALEQNVFELHLKSAVRLYENDNSFKNKAETIILNICHQFELDNGQGSWDKLMSSCYYQYFTDTITKIV